MLSIAPPHPAHQSSIADRLRSLPFRIRAADDEETFKKAAVLRQEAYHRHLPQFSNGLFEPEKSDFAPGCVLFVAESKLDGSILGSVRVHTTLFDPLPLQSSIELPAEYGRSTLGEAARLCVSRDRPGSLVKALLCKAYALFCAEQGVDRLVVTARAPLDRQYEAMGFVDVYPDVSFISMKHVGGVEHRVLTERVDDVIPNFLRLSHPYHEIFTQEHPDFDLTPPASFFNERIIGGGAAELPARALPPV